MKQSHRSTDSIVLEWVLPEPPEQVWRALSDPDLRARWLLPEAESSAMEIELLEAEEHRRVRYRLRDRERARNGREQRSLDSTVTFELSATADGGTHLRLIHSDFAMTTTALVAQRVGPETRAARVVKLEPRNCAVQLRKAA